VIKTFRYAAEGFIHCLKAERNFRIHLCVCAYVIFFSQYYSFDAVHYAVLFLTCGAVMAAEAINTAVEAVTDIASPNLNPLAKTAKDAAAAGVLITVIAAVCVGAAFYFNVPVILAVLDIYINSPLHMASLGMSAVAAVIFTGKRNKAVRRAGDVPQTLGKTE